MKDLKHKSEMVQSINKLQLSDFFIIALDDETQAESIVEAIQSLQTLSNQWN